jgi:uncharacterized CHY-type Zn-finger protein
MTIECDEVYRCFKCDDKFGVALRFSVKAKVVAAERVSVLFGECTGSINRNDCGVCGIVLLIVMKVTKDRSVMLNSCYCLTF